MAAPRGGLAALCLSIGLAPAAFPQTGSDLCSGATAIGDGVYSGDTRTATADGAASCAQGNADVWFLYTASTTGRIVASTFGSNYSTAISVHDPLTDGCPGGLSDQIACTGSCGAYASRVAFNAVVGSTYLLRVTGSSAPAEGDYVLSVGPAPANDLCADAIAVGEGAFTSDGRLATPDGSIAFGPTVWYRYTSTFAGRVSIDTIGSDLPSFVTVNAGCSSSLLDWNGYCGGGPHGCLSRPVTLGQQLWISVGGHECGAGDLRLEIQPAGAIGGLLTDAGSGLPLTNAGSAWVGAYNEFDPHNPFFNPSPIANAVNDSTGYYLAQGLRPGTYFLRVEDAAHVAEIYDDLYVEGSPTSGTPVIVLAGQTTTVDIDLLPPGQITGTITNAVTGAPIEAAVRVYSTQDADLVPLASGSSDASGHYALAIGHLATGVYRVRARAASFQPEVYHDIACPFDVCPPGAGLPVAVTAGATTSGIDFALSPINASLLGRITFQGAHESQLEGLPVQLFDANGELALASNTFGCTIGCSPTGTYFHIEELPAGTYYLRTNFDRSWVLDELWNNAPCGGAACNPLHGTPIVLAPGQHRTGLDIDLGPGGTLTGVVLAADTGLPFGLPLTVSVFSSTGVEISSGVPSANGSWEAAGLGPGDYFASATLPSWGPGYVDEVYPNHHCPSSGCDPLAGTAIHVNANATVAGIDFLLERGDFGGVSGRLSSATTGVGIGNANVEIFDDEGALVSALATTAAGSFATPAGLILPGTYYLRTQTLPYAPGFIDELFDDFACAGGACDPSGGTPVVVQPDLWITGLEMALDPACTGALTLDPPSLPDGAAGAVYSQQLSASGAVGGPAFAVSAGAPPPGLTLTPSGLLAGVPLAAGTFGFSVSVTDAAHCFAARSYAPSFSCALSITPAALPLARETHPYDQRLSALGGTAPSTFELSEGLLPGVALLPDGQLSGTPATGGQSGVYPFTVTATDNLGCSVDQPFVLSVLGTVVFRGDFESGDTSAWSSTLP